MTPARNRRRPLDRTRLLRTALRMLAILAGPGRWDVRGVAAEIGVSLPTAYRILRAARAAGWRLEVQREGWHAYWRATWPTAAAARRGRP